MPKANPSDSIRRLILYGNDDQRLAFGPGTSLATPTPTNVRFVHLNAPREPISSRPDHRSSQLVQPQPGRLVTTWFNHSPQAKGVGTVFLRRDVPHRPKPQTQRLTSAVENRTGGYRNLGPAAATMSQRPLGPPRLVCPTVRTLKTIWPTQSGQVLQASGLPREQLLELCQRTGIILHTQTLHPVVTGVNPIPQLTFSGPMGS